MNLKFSGRALAYLSHFKAESDIRYYLNGVYVAPMPPEAGGGVIGAATKGRVLGMWHDKEGHVTRPAILRISKQLARACASKETRGQQTTLVLSDNRLACMCGPEELYIQPNEYRDPANKPKNGWDREPWEVDGDFPDLGRVVPSPSEATIGMTGAVSADYLGLIAKAMPKGLSKWGTGVTIRQVHQNGQNLVFFDRLPEAPAIIMPMRNEGAAPDWLPRWKKADQKVKDAKAAPRPAMPSDAAPPPDFVPVRIAGGRAGRYPA